MAHIDPSKSHLYEPPALKRTRKQDPKAFHLSWNRSSIRTNSTKSLTEVTWICLILFLQVIKTETGPMLEQRGALGKAMCV